MIRTLVLIAAALLVGSLNGYAGTIATLNTSVGRMELELYDEGKPVTVSNFIKYVTSGRFEDLFVQRWVTNFVIQAGGYYVETVGETSEFREVPVFGQITNEYSVGPEFSNVYGTIAMARQGGKTNSATSQWFLNAKDNVFLDDVDGGFTVFGRLVSGTEVLSLFVPPPGTHNLYQAPIPPHLNSHSEVIQLDNPPVIGTNATFANLVYIDISLRRELNVSVGFEGNSRVVSWDSVDGVTNIVDHSTSFPPVWQTLTSVIGTGERMRVTDGSPKRGRQMFRVRLVY